MGVLALKETEIIEPANSVDPDKALIISSLILIYFALNYQYDTLCFTLQTLFVVCIMFYIFSLFYLALYHLPPSTSTFP